MLNDDAGIAGNVLAHEIGSEPGIEVIRTSRGVAKHYPYCLALVELLGALCQGGDVGDGDKRRGQ
jgi:hypothetical protein